MRNSAFLYFFALLFGITLFSGCSSQKESAGSKGMQNLTARYNILYNAHLLMEESGQNMDAAYRENYVALLPVYREPSEALALPEGKKLDEVIQKANKIIAEKSASNYTDDAYFLIGQANYQKASFFNAVEFFNYVIETYPKEQELRQGSMVMKARALMQLERFEEAETVLDTAFRNTGSSKRSLADLYATRAQLHLFASENEEAVKLLQQAAAESRDKDHTIRWYYILGQLSQMLGRPEEAYRYFTEVSRSNAPFEMAFNAELNRIGFEEEKGGQSLSRTERLARLLKDDKNRDLKDQIWYQIGESYLKENNTAQAIASYNNAVRASTTNATQKGLGYLKLAEVYFRSGQYVTSKLYYDSTLATLPKTYPGFELVAKTADNLLLLSSRLQTIATEDSLQAIALLPETEREARIGQLVRERARKAIDQDLSEAPQNPVIPADSPEGQQALTDGKFYFNNLTAIGQGFSDFKRRWGNRRLDDNWRRSQKTSAEIANAPVGSANTGGPATSPPVVTVDENAMAENIRKSLPVTPEQLNVSNRRIAAAYFDIGNYYRDILNDEAQAIKTFEDLNTRFPDNENKLAVYYNLYRLYARSNPAKSEEYRRLLLEKYPESPYARVILDPNYLQRANEKEMAVARAFDRAHADYIRKDYPAVLNGIVNAQAYGPTAYSAQLDYLKALAIGRTQNLAPFESALKDIVAAYPADNLTTPLVKQHLDYVAANRSKLAARQFVIVDYDPNEPRYEEPLTDSPSTPVTARRPANQPVAPVSGAPVTSAPPAVPGSTAPVSTQPAAKPASMFSLPDTATYYFVVNVLDPGANLSSSRFGIGQFNRLNFPDGNIRHQLKQVNQENQLIYVGEFHSRQTVSNYADNILPLMPQIMKIPAGRYNMFVITAQDLEKLTNRDLINQYLEFFNTNYAN